MELSDPVSCLLCLDAWERPTMLRVQLRPIGDGAPREHLICQRCGGAIAAEYLYVQNKNKAEAAGANQAATAAANGADRNVEIPSSSVVTDSAAVGETAAAPGEAKTVCLRGLSAEPPRVPTK